MNITIENVLANNDTINSTLRDQLTFLSNKLENYFREAVEHLLLSLFLYLILCVVLYIATIRWFHLVSLQREPRRVLFITAHPDDECMFFGPSILKLAQKKTCQVFLLCLSKGNHDGLGNIRKSELWKASSKLGILPENVTILNNPHMQDGPVRWRESTVARIIIKHIESLSIDTIITFDEQGVSSHPNHSSIFYALAYLYLDKRLPDYCTVYTLDSTNLLRKYWLLLDIPLSYVLSSYRIILSWSERTRVVDAMCQHSSQLVWFRKLYMIFSRYTIINTLTEMNIIDLELDFDINTRDD